MRRLTALGAAVVILSTGCSSPEREIPLGFTRESADAQRSLEQRLIERADAAREDVRKSTHEVLLPRALEVSVEASAPFAWRAQMPEGIDGAPGPSSPSPRELLPYHAFSASGEVNAPVVYAGPGA